jgi:hypothetical protein
MAQSPDTTEPSPTKQIKPASGDVDGTPNPDKASAGLSEKERQLDDALANTFPASDPISVSP